MLGSRQQHILNCPKISKAPILGQWLISEHMKMLQTRVVVLLLIWQEVIFNTVLVVSISNLSKLKYKNKVRPMKKLWVKILTLLIKDQRALKAREKLLRFYKTINLLLPLCCNNTLWTIKITKRLANLFINHLSLSLLLLKLQRS